MGIRRAVLSTVVALAAVAGAPTGAGCPGAEQLLLRVGEVRSLAPSARPELDVVLPDARLRRAAAEPGHAVTARAGRSAVGAVVAPLSIERLWSAVNDSEHHPQLMPIRASTVIEGEPRGVDRRIFQYFQRWGIGRWWVNRVTMNAAAYERSDGRIWELHWYDDPVPADVEHPDVAPVAARVRSIESSRGVWTMLPIGEHCTFVEFATSSDPGGMLGVMQRPLIRRAVRDTLDALLAMAGDHMSQPHPGPPFVRPDGTPLVATGEPTRSAR